MPSEEIEQAYKKLRNIIMMPKNKTSLDILKIWYTEEDAEILAAGPFTTVQQDRFTVEEYAARTGFPVEKIQETFNRLCKRGVLFWHIDRKEDNKKKYMIPPLFPGLVEYFIVSPHNSIDERRAFVKKMHKLEGGGIASNTMDSNYSIFRIIPSLKPEPESRVIEIEHKVEPDK